MPENSILKFGRTEAGYRLRIEGRGTMRESRSAEVFVAEVLGAADAVLVVDLSGCHYLDSTFLGFLLGLHSRHGQPRFRVASPAELTRKLFGPTKLDAILRITPDLPDIIGEYVILPGEMINSAEMKRHIMECHRRLADIAGPQQSAFAAIARQMEQELEKT